MTKVVQTAGRDSLGTFAPLFGTGAPNDAYAQYFTGRSYLNPLTDPEKTQFIANVTFEPGRREQLAHPPCDRGRRPDPARHRRRGLVSGMGRRGPQDRRR